MALSREDKSDVKRHLGKSVANKISRVTRDGEQDFHKKFAGAKHKALSKKSGDSPKKEFVPHKRRLTANSLSARAARTAGAKIAERRGWETNDGRKPQL